MYGKLKCCRCGFLAKKVLCVPNRNETFWVKKPLQSIDYLRIAGGPSPKRGAQDDRLKGDIRHGTPTTDENRRKKNGRNLHSGSALSGQG